MIGEDVWKRGRGRSVEAAEGSEDFDTGDWLCIVFPTLWLLCGGKRGCRKPVVNHSRSRMRDAGDSEEEDLHGQTRCIPATALGTHSLVRACC